MTFFAFRTFDNVTRIAAFAHRALGFVVHGESVVAAQPAQKTRTFRFRVVAELQTRRGRPL